MATNNSPLNVPRFRVRTLLAYTAAVALVLAALLQPSNWWWSAITTVTLFFLGCAIAIAIVTRGRTRAFWLGFGLVGGLFFAASRAGLNFMGIDYDHLVTMQAVIRIGEFVHSDASTERAYFEMIACDLCTLLCAVLAGFFCQWACGRKPLLQDSPCAADLERG
jgi:hypothetical protein